MPANNKIGSISETIELDEITREIQQLSISGISERPKIEGPTRESVGPDSELVGINIDMGLGSLPIDQDPVRANYYTDQESGKTGTYVLARSFRSGGGAAQEYDMTQNISMYNLFCNPSTVLSDKIPTKTISQLGNNDWTGEPSFLFAVDVNDVDSIANYGVASMNSFSSSAAIGILAQLGELRDEKTIAFKLTLLKDFCDLFWKENINQTVEEFSNHNKREQMKVKQPKKVLTFQKPFNLEFHKQEKFFWLMKTLEELGEALKQASNFDAIDVTDCPEVKDAIDQAPSRNWLLPENRAEALKLVEKVLLAKGPTAYSEEEKKRIIGDYKEYLEMGFRHNEMVSRIYPWEMSGIEWGSTASLSNSNENAVADLIETTEKRQKTLIELEQQGIESRLFNDFMINKISFDYPYENTKGIRKILDAMKSTEQGRKELNDILDKIKTKLSLPLCIYQYDHIKREMINISDLVYRYQNDLIPEENTSELALAEYAVKKFQEGINVYKNRKENKALLHPRSNIRKENVYIKVPEFSDDEKYFWEKEQFDALQASIFQKIADDVIDTPYVDDNRKQKDSNGNTIFRPNHDVTHACRQVFYVNCLLLYLFNEKVEPWEVLQDEFTKEEIACLQLAAYLCRSGRTNEAGGRDDPTGTTRSANVFRIVAKQLGFDSQLISDIALMISTHMPIDGTKDIDFPCEGFSASKDDRGIKIAKAKALKRLLDITHNLDLVRCQSWREYFENEDKFKEIKKDDASAKAFKFECINGLASIMESGNKQYAEKIIDKMLVIAKQSCEITGTPVRYNGFTDAEKVQDYDSPVKDPDVLALIRPFMIPGGIQVTLTKKKEELVLLKDLKWFMKNHVEIAFQLFENLKSVKQFILDKRAPAKALPVTPSLAVPQMRIASKANPQLADIKSATISSTTSNTGGGSVTVVPPKKPNTVASTENTKNAEHPRPKKSKS